jgi:hypothetical protein
MIYFTLIANRTLIFHEFESRRKRKKKKAIFTGMRKTDEKT